jgi:hypothetical protein
MILNLCTLYNRKGYRSASLVYPKNLWSSVIISKKMTRRSRSCGGLALTLHEPRNPAAIDDRLPCLDRIHHRINVFYVKFSYRSSGSGACVQVQGNFLCLFYPPRLRTFAEFMRPQILI